MAQETKTTPEAQTRRKAFLGLAEYVWNPVKARWLLRPKWKYISVTFVSLMILSYLGFAGWLYARDRWIRGSTETSYTEMLIFAFPDPIYFTNKHWAPGFIARRVEQARESHRRKMATALFAKAKSALESKEYGNFQQNVLIAAQLDPSNMEARMMAAQIFLMARREDDALDTLEQALPRQLDKPDYVGTFLTTCFQQEKEARIVGLSKYFLAKPDLSPAMKEIFATSMAAAHFYRGEFDDCQAAIDKYGIGRTPQGFMLSVRILWEKGLREEAIARLEPVATTNITMPGMMEALIDMKIKNGDINGALNTATVALIRAPEQFQTRIGVIEILDKKGEKERVDKEIETYLNEFAKNQPAMMKLCEFCADRGRVTLCEQIMTRAESEHFKDAPRYRLLYIESHLAAGRFEEAIALVDRMFIENPAWLEQYRVEFDCLRMVAQMSLSRDDMGDISFRRLAESRNNLRMNLMTIVAKKLIQVGRTEDAMRVIDFAYERNARALTALGQVLEIHLAAGGGPSTPKLIREQLDRRRPLTDILRQARTIVSGDAYLFEPDREKLIADIETLASGKPILPPVPVKTPVEKLGQQ